MLLLNPKIRAGQVEVEVHGVDDIFRETAPFYVETVRRQIVERYGNERLEAACARALGVRARSYRHVESILKNGLDRLPSPAEGDDEGATPTAHENIRGGGYYH